MEKKRRQYGAELKLKCVMEREAGKTFAQIARENSVPYTTVISWCKAGKDKILKEQYDGAEQEIAVDLEDAMPRKVNVEDLKKENKALKEELSYYRHKAAYLEALNQILLEDAGEEEAVKKKRYRAIARAKVPAEKKNVRRLCAVAGVPPKCYYYSLKPKPKEKEDARLVGEIRALQDAHSYSLGYRKMAMQLSRRLGKPINEKRVERLMRESGLLSKVRRKKYSEEVYAARRVAESMKIPDLVGRRFFSSSPRRVFVQDITCLPCLEGTLYLNSIEDLYNGEIVAWKISRHPDTRLVLDSLELLVERLEGRTEGVILHSDLGSSYTAQAYRTRLEELGMRISFGAKGSCYDNARMESLNGIIKTEALYCAFGKSKVNGRRIPEAEILERTERFIEYYNNERGKKSLGKLSPVQFRLLHPNGTELMALSDSR